MNFFQILTYGATHFPSKTAVISDKRRLSYAELLSLSNQVAGGMAAAGVTSGARVALICHNCIEYLAVTFACARLGCVAVHLNTRSSAEELDRLLREAAPQLLFLSARLGEKASALLSRSQRPTWRTVAVGGPLKGALDLGDLLRLPGWDQELPDLPEGGEAPCMQYYTSGSSGRPKGVLHSHHALIFHTLVNAREGGYNAETIYQFSSPLFHAAAAGAYNTLSVGGTLVLIDHVVPGSFLATLEREQVNFASINPYLMRKLVDSGIMADYDLSTLTRISYAGAPVNPELLDRMMELLPGRAFVQYYGMTEMAPTICVLYPEDHLDTGTPGRRGHRYSAGRPAMFVELKIVSPEGHLCPTGVCGEIAVRGPCMMLGYTSVAEPSQKASAVRDGWYHTGDLGWLDRDGFLFLEGRKDDIVVSGGENISCTEVERCLYKLPGIRQAAVVGVADAQWGQKVSAFLVLEPDSTLAEAEVMAFCRQRLGYKSPKSVVFCEDLPKNAAGKIDKQTLKERSVTG